MNASQKNIDPKALKVTQDFLWRIKERYDISGALLFGSRARGTHHATSDADVAVILRGEPRRLLPTKLDMLDAAYDIMLESDIRISPLPIWIEEWEHPEDYSNPRLLENIRRDGVWL